MKQPVYLLAGGRLKRQNEGKSVLDTVLQECGIDAPEIAYIGTANGDDPGFFHRMEQELIRSGAGEVHHAVISAKGADLSRSKDILKSADMVFVSGGDVDAGMSGLVESGMIPLLTELFEQGKAFFGISAGSIMLAEKWVRWLDPDDVDSAELFPCLGFAPVIIDCHDEDSGWEELQAALKLEKVFIHGYGLAAGSAIRVTPDGAVKALGTAVHCLVRDGKKIYRTADLQPD